MNLYKTIQVGITGGIGSGKSVVCKVFRTLGAPVYDADFHAKRLMSENSFLIENIQRIFGNESYTIFNNKKQLNRLYIAKVAFEDPSKLQKLNAIVHPVVREDFLHWKAEYDGKVPYIIREAALLLESGFAHELDCIVGVFAPESIRMQRILQRDPHRTEEDIKRIMNQQLPEATFRQKVHTCIENDGFTPILAQLLDLHHQWIQQSQQPTFLSL
ncbi:MAG: dephospho-CoA kinase [Cytophagales bacterium]|nr:dephospho-CoA kinase [Cytophagales bacterium]MDW8383283.1 dephospho-CoA kinase [Flammeovirgaceae bacterium]